MSPDDARMHIARIQQAAELAHELGRDRLTLESTPAANRALGIRGELLIDRGHGRRVYSFRVPRLLAACARAQAALDAMEETPCPDSPA